MEKVLSREAAINVYERVLAVDVEAIQPVTRDRLYLSHFAKPLRVFLRGLGFTNRQISVVVPDYSMVQAIQVTLPTATYADVTKGTRNDQDRYAAWDDFWSLREDARGALNDIILAGFPGTGDRSDAQTDYFDYQFSVS